MAAPPDPPDRLPDEELLARLRDGDRDVFGTLVRRYERELYGYLRRYLGDDDLAADVFQNTFVAVFVKIAQYEPGRPARPWLYAIATNQAIDATRRRARRGAALAADVAGGDPADDAPSPLDAQPARDPDPAAEAALTEERRQVRAAVERLPDLLRQVVLLAYFQGMKYQDIAAALGVPLGTVKSRLHAAVAKLGEGWAAPAGHPQ